MGNISWTETQSDGDNYKASNITNMKNDITSVINGNISNSNLASDASVSESKISFDTTSGHSHNGTNSRLVTLKHYRKGCLLKAGTTANTDVKVTPGVIDIGGTTLTSVADINISVDNAGNYADGGSEPADGPIYVYGYNNSGALGIKLSTETPDLSDASDNTAEFPVRYQKYSTTYYRLLGVAHNRGDLLPDMFCHFDASNFATGSFTADGNDETVYLGWTPDMVMWWLCSDNTPATGETFDIGAMVQKYSFANAAPNPQNLYWDLKNNTHVTSANGTVNSLYNLNTQTTAQPGSFTIDAPTSGQVLVWMAWSHGWRG